MALTDTTVPYEILVRFGIDGQVQGAHVQRRRLVLDDGKILLDQPQPAEALGISDFPTSGVMTAAAAAALATVNRQAAQIASLQAQVGALETEKSNLLVLVDQLQAQVSSEEAA